MPVMTVTVQISRGGNKRSSLCVRLLRKPELAGEIDTELLGKLLPKELLEPLEEQYLSKQKVS